MVSPPGEMDLFYNAPISGPWPFFAVVALLSSLWGVRPEVSLPNVIGYFFF